jgi:enoyl-CoA hydratase
VPQASSIRATRPQDHPHVLLITIDRPPVNAMSLDAHRELLGALRSVETPDPGQADIRCIVLTGAGDRAFVAGGDVGELGSMDAASALERTRVIRNVFDAIRRNPVPVIGAINGHALGSGMVMVAQCDIVYAAENASFGLPEINVGVMGGTKHLARIVPEKVMRWMALTGNRVDAHFLHRLGVIQQVLPRDQVLAAALRAADDICAKSPASVRLMKEVVNLTEHMNLEDGYHVETYATAIIKTHPDSMEAAQAFREKRPARFGGSDPKHAPADRGPGSTPHDQESP